MELMTYRITRKHRMGQLLLWLGLILCVAVASCAPTAAVCAPPKAEKRCIVLIGATWCQPCNTMESTVLHQLSLDGLKVKPFKDRTDADIHIVHVDKDADPRPGWKITEDYIPLAVVFEGREIVAINRGPFDKSQLLTMLNRPQPATDGHTAAVDDTAGHSSTYEDAAGRHATTDDAGPALQPVADSAKSTWDQLTEFIGCDEVTMTLVVPNGRKIVLSEANAAATIPDHLTAHVRMNGETIEVKFDAPLIQAEGKRFGIRLGTSVPNVSLTRDQVTVHTGLGIPIRWKRTETPFGESPPVP